MYYYILLYMKVCVLCCVDRRDPPLDKLSHQAPLGSINWENAEQALQSFSGGDTPTHLGELEPCNAHTTDASEFQGDLGLYGHVQQHLGEPMGAWTVPSQIWQHD